MLKKNHHRPDQKRRFLIGTEDGAVVVITGALVVGRVAALGLGAGSVTGALDFAALLCAFLDSLLGCLVGGRTGAIVGAFVGALVGR